MSVDTPSVYDRFDVICGYLGGSDDVSAVQALAEEVGVAAVINARNRWGESCVLVASYNDRVKTARQLIAWRADVDSRTKNDATPLFCVKSAEMVRVLVKEGGAKVNVITTHGSSPLSVTTAHPEVTEALVEEGALVMFGRYNPLVHTQRRHVEAMKVLLARRGFVRVIEWKASIDQTAREMAVSEERHEIVAMLDEAVVLAKVWNRRLCGVRVGLAAADARVARVARPSSKRPGAKKKSKSLV